MISSCGSYSTQYQKFFDKKKDGYIWTGSAAGSLRLNTFLEADILQSNFYLEAQIHKGVD